MTNELLLDGRLRDRGIFEPREISRLWQEHRTGRAEHPHRLWQLVMLELWFRRFIDEAPSEAVAMPVSACQGSGAPQAAGSSSWAPAAQTLTEAM